MNYRLTYSRMLCSHKGLLVRCVILFVAVVVISSALLFSLRCCFFSLFFSPYYITGVVFCMAH